MSFDNPAELAISHSDENNLSPLNIGLYFQYRGFSVIPLGNDLLVPKAAAAYLSSSIKFSATSLERVMWDYHNLGVITGKNSRNLFIIRAENVEVYEKLLDRLGDLETWVSITKNEYDIWFFCKSGVVSNATLFPGAKILGHGKVIPVPGNRIAGEITTFWVEHNSILPTELCEEQMQVLFPNIFISPVSNQAERDKLSRESYLGLPSMTISNSAECTEIEQYLLSANNQSMGKGKIGLNRQSVLNAMCFRASKEDRNNFRATHREISLLSGVPLSSIGGCLHYLLNNNLIEIQSKKLEGNRYRLCSNARFDHITTGSNNVVKLVKLPVHDIWTTHGLSLCGKEIAECLIKAATFDRRLSAIEISKETSISTNTVRTKLNQMYALDLVQKEHRRWFTDPILFKPELLDEKAGLMEVNGCTQRKKDKIRNEREYFAVQITRKSMANERFIKNKKNKIKDESATYSFNNGNYLTDIHSIEINELVAQNEMASEVC
jgi:hypothetical protein